MKLKKVLSLVLALCLIASTASVAVITASANAGDSVHRKLITDVLNSEPGNQADTNTYYFYLPEEWKNKYNDYYNYNADTKTFDGEDGNFAAGIYWWEGPYNCNDYKGDLENSWPGYAVTETLAADSNIYKAEVPKIAGKFIWNNLVDGGTDKSQPVYTASIQTTGISNEYYDPGEDGYGFYPDGTESFDGMIYVCDPEATEKVSDVDNFKLTYKGAWFYYYGNGEYGYYKTRGEAKANNAVYKNGEFPKLKSSETVTVKYMNKLNWEDVYLGVSNDYEVEEILPAEKTTNKYGDEIYTFTFDSKYTRFDFIGGAAGEITEGVDFDPEVEGYYPAEKNKRGKWEVDSWKYGEEPVNTRIYFDAADWKNVSYVFCHIWERGGDSFFAWQSKSERCKLENGKYVYDTFALKDSLSSSPKGLEADKDYCVIFSSDTGKQTYDCTFGLACLGDTIKLSDGVKVENPVDSEKTADEALWQNNGENYGPHLALTSIGNVVGTFLCPNETGTEVIGDWLPTYYKSQFVNPIDALADAFPKFEIKTYDDVTAIYNYIVDKETGEDEGKMKEILDDAYAKMLNNNPTDPTQDPSGDNPGVTDPTQAPSSDPAVTDPAETPTSEKPSATAPTRSAKKPNPVKISGKTKSIKAKKLKKSKMTVKPLSISKNQGKITVTKVKKGTTSKIYNKITVNKKTGAITFKKGKYAKKTYKIKLQIKVAGNSNYRAKTLTKVVKVKIK